MDETTLAHEVAARIRVCPTCDGTEESWDEETGTPFCPECEDEMYSLPESIALAVLKEAEKQRAAQLQDEAAPSTAHQCEEECCLPK